MNVCPHCNQRMLMRHGVQLSPREADLFDLIAARKNDGIHMDVLAWTWAGASKSAAAQRNLVKTTIYHINERLAATDVLIKGEGRHPVIYRVRGA